MRLLDEEASKCGSWRRAFPVANGYIYRPFFAKERPLNWLLCDVLARRARGEPDVGPFVAPYPSVPHQPASERPVHATAAAAAAATAAAAAAAGRALARWTHRCKELGLGAGSAHLRWRGHLDERA